MKRAEAAVRKLTGCKDLSISFFIRLKTGILHPDSTRVEINNGSKKCTICNHYNHKVEETIWFSWEGCESKWQRSIKNVSGKKLQLVETGLTLKNIDFGKRYRSGDNYFYHVENPRIYKMMTMPVDLKLTPELVKKSEWDCLLEETGFVDPAITTERIGASPYQPFPAVLLSNYGMKKGIVHGTLSQNVFYHNYTFRHDKGKLEWGIFSSLKGIPYRDFPPGETIGSDMWYLGITEYANDIGEIFEGYLAELRKYLPVSRGRTRTNRYSVMWGSANDGPCQDIDQQRILKTAGFIRKNLPTVEWIYIDWGYGKTGDFKGGLSVPCEGETDIDLDKFPEGMKRFADRVKLAGLKPAIWIANMIERKTRLAREHPEWLYDRFPSEKGPRILDISIPEARSYMEKSLDRLITEYGFEGVKHDLWSYPFEDSRPLFSVKDKSGYELRNWWACEMRKRLPPWGYMQTGCDIVMANPFLGEFFNNYRYGIDINEGNWNNVEANMLWGAACFATRSGDLFVPNSDAVGILRKLTDNEYILWINYCIVTRSIVEIAGWLHENHRHPRFKFMKKALCCPNNGQDVYFCDYDYRKTDKPPDRWYFHGAHFSLAQKNPHLPVRTVAIFNLSDSVKNFKVDYSKLGLPKGEYTATDIWSLRTSSLQDYKNISMEPRSSILFSVNGKGAGLQVLDANVKIEGADFKNKKLSLKLAYKGKFRIALSQKPEKAGFSVKGGRAKIVRGEGNWMVEGEIPSAGSLLVSF